MNQTRFAAAAALVTSLSLAGCSGTSSPAAPSANYSDVAKHVDRLSRVKADTGTFTLYKAPASTAFAGANMVLGPDGNFWYATQVIIKKKTAGAIIRFTPKGVATTFVIPNSGSIQVYDPTSVTVGPDGNIWFSSYDCTIGSITTAGVFQQEYTLDSSGGCNLTIGASTDATGIWFTNAGTTNYVGYITTGGSVSQYQLAQGSVLNGGNQIVLGSDGNFWFTEGLNSNSNIGRVRPDGAVSLFPASAENVSSIISGPDGNLWYIGNELGVMNTSGQVLATYPVTGYNLTTGADGNIWLSGGSGLVQVTPTGTITNFPFPKSDRKYRPYGLAVGSDSNMWFDTTGFGNGKDPKGMGKFVL